MRLSVECTFPHLGKRGAASRKSAVCMWNITEKRSLWLWRHQKAQSAVRRLGRMRFSVSPDSKPRFAGPGTTRPAGWRGVARAHLPSWAIFHSAPQPGGRLPRTSRAPQRDGKAHSAQTASRKSAFCVDDLTEKHILALATHGKVHSVWATRWKGHSVRWPSRKSAFRVRAATQSAPFREGLQPECTFP